MNSTSALQQDICIDACVAVQWVIPEPFSAEALALYEDSLRGGYRLVSTLLLPFEVTGAIYKRIWRQMSPAGLLTVAEAQALLVDFDSFQVCLETHPGIHAGAIDLAHQYGLGHSHDAHYLALARHLGCDLWTADQRLWNAVRGHAPDVFWLGDYPL